MFGAMSLKMQQLNWCINMLKYLNRLDVANTVASCALPGDPTQILYLESLAGHLQQPAEQRMSNLSINKSHFTGCGPHLGQKKLFESAVSVLRQF